MTCDWTAYTGTGLASATTRYRSCVQRHGKGARTLTPALSLHTEISTNQEATHHAPSLSEHQNPLQNLFLIVLAVAGHPARLRPLVQLLNLSIHDHGHVLLYPSLLRSRRVPWICKCHAVLVAFLFLLPPISSSNSSHRYSRTIHLQ